MGYMTGKTVLITGGGGSVLINSKCGSIGYGIATAFAKEGANIALTGRNMDKLMAAKEELERLYGFRKGPFPCEENAKALAAVEEALTWLKKRTNDRAERCVLGHEAK